MNWVNCTLNVLVNFLEHLKKCVHEFFVNVTHLTPFFCRLTISDFILTLTACFFLGLGLSCHFFHFDLRLPRFFFFDYFFQRSCQSSIIDHINLKIGNYRFFNFVTDEPSQDGALRALNGYWFEATDDGSVDGGAFSTTALWGEGSIELPDDYFLHEEPGGSGFTGMICVDMRVGAWIFIFFVGLFKLILAKGKSWKITAHVLFERGRFGIGIWVLLVFTDSIHWNDRVDFWELYRGFRQKLIHVVGFTCFRA